VNGNDMHIAVALEVGMCSKGWGAVLCLTATKNCTVQVRVPSQTRCRGSTQHTSTQAMKAAAFLALVAFAPAAEAVRARPVLGPSIPQPRTWLLFCLLRTHATHGAPHTPQARLLKQATSEVQGAQHTLGVARHRGGLGWDTGHEMSQLCGSLGG